MENQNNWKNPLLVACISLAIILIFALSAWEGKLDALSLGMVFLFQSTISFFIAVGQLVFAKNKQEGLRQMLISGILLLISFGVCSQGSLDY
jgi:hypothetical protein